MTRDTYLIVRIDYTLVPASLSYVGHGDTPHLNLRFTSFRSSATEYSNKRDAIREAKRLARTFNSYLFKVNGTRGHNTVYISREVS